MPEVHFPVTHKVEEDPLRKRFSHQAKGMILKLDNGLLVVPFEDEGRYGWKAVVVGSKRGGYNVSVSRRAVEQAEEVSPAEMREAFSG